jgi:hypothetical protein
MNHTPSLPAHSLLGASSAARWLKCPGSFHLSQSAPTSPASIYAATGTLAHSFIEGCLRHPISRMEYSSIGNAYTIEGHQIMVDGVNTMIDYIVSRLANFDTMLVETTVHLDGYFPHKMPVKLFGTADVILINAREMEIVDYKNGSGVIVDPNDNPQTLYYAAGAMMQRQKIPEKIKMTIVQPHARSVAKVRSATLDYVDLMMWIDETLIPGVEACIAPDAPLVPGSWCRFCPVSFACPALVAEANRMAKLEFDDSRVKVDDPDELSRLLDVAQRARAWCDAVEAFALDQLKRQVRVPNWSLVPTRPMRRWIEEGAAAAMLNGVGAHGIYKNDLKSPAQIEKLVRKQFNNQTWDDRIAPLVENVSSGVKLQRDGSAPFEDYEP